MSIRNDIMPVLEGVILEEQEGLSLGELCRLCGVHAEYVLDLVDEGILEPAVQGKRYRFPGECVVRTRKAIRLQRDMGMNLAGVAMVLDLLDQIEELKEIIRHELYR